MSTAIKFNDYPTHEEITKPQKARDPTPEARAGVILPFIGRISHHIQRVLNTANVVIRHRLTHKLESILHTYKDRGTPNHHPGVYHIPCECGKVYTGETGRTFTTRVKQHQTHNRRGEQEK